MTQSSSIYSLYNNSAWHPFSSRTSAVRQLLPKLFKPCSKWSFLRMEPSAEFDEKFWVKIRQKWDLKGKGQPPQQAHRLWRPKNQPSGKWLYSNPEPIFCVFLLGEDLWDRISEFLEKKFPFLLENGCRALLYYVRYRQTLQLNHLERITRGRILFV